MNILHGQWQRSGAGETIGVIGWTDSRHMLGSSSHLTMTPQLGKPFAWPYPLDTADPGEHVAPLDHLGGRHDPPRTQDT